VPKTNKTKADNGTEILRVFPWEYYVQPVSVEMTSYSLLTYILRGKAADALPLVRWLLNQRNAYGGFISTQDTVLGLTALAQYAELTKAKETDLEVKFKDGSAEKSVSVNDKNAQVVQEFELPQTTRSLDVAATGKGSVLAQLTWTYYVEDPVRDPAFAVNVNVSKPTAEELALDICTKYLGTEGSSNMAIVEVNLPSGYAFDTESLVQLKSAKDYKRYDLENQNTKLAAYFTSVSSEETCFPLLASRVFKVGKQSPAYVSVYDYYDTTKTARAFYEPPQTSICDICLESNDCTENNCV
jgi:CD109 antigen